MKRSSIVLIVLAISSPAYCQFIIPGGVVYDPAKVEQSIQNFKQTMEQWRQQQQQLSLTQSTNEANLQLLDQQLQTTTGQYAMGGLFNNITQPLPNNWQMAFNAVPTQGASALTPDAQQIYNSAMIFNPCQNQTGQAITVCQANAAQTSQNLANINAATQNISTEQQNIKLLMCQVDVTRDAKAAQDLITRMKAEQSIITVQGMTLETYKYMSAKQSDMTRERARQLLMEAGNRPNSLPPVIVEFDKQ